MEIRDNAYITIQSFMIKDLELKGNELLVYAIIYGFSQDGDSKFSGSLQYLADWTNSTKQGVLKNIKSLIEKDLIEKHEYKYNNMNLISYSSKFNRGKQSLMGIQQSLPNNINNNIDIKENNINIIKEKPNTNDSILSNVNVNINDNDKTGVKQNRETFIKPKIEDVIEYCKERNNNINAEYWYDYYQSKGWMVGKTKMKDWKAAIRNWERNDKERIKQVTIEEIKTITKEEEKYE